MLLSQDLANIIIKKDQLDYCYFRNIILKLLKNFSFEEKGEARRPQLGCSTPPIYERRVLTPHRSTGTSNSTTPTDF